METQFDKFGIKGFLQARFEDVRNAFLQNFTEGLEAGAGFCVIHKGEVVIDLIGGTRDKHQTMPWEKDTLVPVFSTTKAVASVVIAWLVEQGRLEYEQKVTDLWPEFGTHGKDVLSIAQVLSHQSGLSGITDAMEPQDWFDWEGIIIRLAAQKPIWPPGTASGYHPLTFGYLVGEIARRADAQHRTLGTILREEFCDPHNIDFYIGTPESEFPRCAELFKPRQLSDLGEINAATKAAFLEPWSSPGRRGTEAWRSFEFAGANGHGTARSLARLMQLALNGTIDGQAYLSPTTLSALSEERICGPDLVLPFDLCFAAGLMLSKPNFYYGPNPDALGHSGWGGSCVFVDREADLVGAYVMNRQSNVLLGDPRPLRLIEALYRCL
ncbi:MAG TPA: class A beta-lactamase-related serine hydrolase [Hellea balneolensis]|uniref:Class A beta-lactamase-related serine hydrolase n=1 Tax=Hellea balneolensis TaxID=287478 RepID=A0A7V5U0X0_9PROT|nr:class A beta-lactamase-related serine hydrolase [Hellea balneolensis]